jgi:hypothetical protein
MKKILAPALTVFALFAVSSCGDDPDASGPPILVLSAANGGGWSADAPAASESTTGMDGKMMWGYLQNFTAASDLPALDSNARSYTLSTGDVSTDSLNALKTAFGLTEDFVAQDASQGGGYLSGNYDGTTPTMYVGSDPMHYWSFSPVWDESSMSSRPCIIDSDTTYVPTSDVPAPIAEICAEPAAPENVPTKAEAEELFATTVRALGANVDDLVIYSYADEWGANVNGYLKIDGVRSSLTWSIGYGANGEISWASGVLADVQDGASYPRIGTTAALERLNSQQSDMWGDPMVRGGVAYDTGVSSDIAATPVPEPVPSEVEAAVSTAPATSDMVPETYPVTDAPAPEVQEVSIVGVEEELVTLYGADGSIYLVPGYTFIAAEDEFGYVGRYTVSALPDEYMQVTDAVDAVPATDVPVPDTAVALPSVDPAVDPTVAPDTSVAQEVADSVVGMSEAEAIKTAEAKGLTVRVGSRDGEDFALTMDYRTDRVTLTVIADKVTAATPG